MPGNSSQVRPSRTRPLRPGGPDRRRVRAVCQGTDQTLRRAGRPGRTPWVGPEKSTFPHPACSASQTGPPGRGATYRSGFREPLPCRTAVTAAQPFLLDAERCRILGGMVTGRLQMVEDSPEQARRARALGLMRCRPLESTSGTIRRFPSPGLLYESVRVTRPLLLSRTRPARGSDSAGSRKGWSRGRGDLGIDS